MADIDAVDSGAGVVEPAGSELEPGPEPVAAGPARSPIREVLALPSFRRYWFSQLAIALVHGTVRFAIVWLVLDLTDWAPAVGLVGLALGIPAMVVSLPAGALSDRIDRIRLVTVGSAVTALALGALAVAIWADVIAVWSVAVAAVVIGSTLALIAPALQAVVPALVPPERLMTGVGLQGMSMNIAMLTGSVLGGIAIALTGTGGAMAVLGAISLLAALGMSGVRLPDRAPPSVERRVIADMVDGLRFVVRREPLRSMLAVGFVASAAWGVVQLVLPDVLRTTLGQDAFATSLVFGALGIGMLVTTLTISNRDAIARRGRLLAIPFSAFCGTSIIVMGVSRSYALTFAAMIWWGVTGGIVMTLQRTILQESTPNEYMGRVMGCNALAMTGSYPLAAAASAAGTAVFGGPGALVAAGILVTIAASLVVWRPAVQRI
ncbi:MAG: MFS transporter [Acidimicrobiales bacterium]